jgi:hypothetical protein
MIVQVGLGRKAVKQVNTITESRLLSNTPFFLIFYTSSSDRLGLFFDLEKQFSLFYPHSLTTKGKENFPQ